MSSDESVNLDYERYIILRWGFQVVKDAQIEWNNNKNRPPIILDRESRLLIWYCSTHMQVLDFGVPGQACRIIEFYLTKKIRHYHATHPDNASLVEFRGRLLRSFPLVMAGSIIIATHMYHETKTITAEVALNCLMQIGFNNFTIEEIEIKRLEIVNCNDLQLPLWSTTEVAKILANYVGAPTYTHRFIEIFVHVGEFMRYQINEDLRGSFISDILGNDRVLAVDLAAASVYAATVHFKCATLTTLLRLMGPTGAPNIFIIYLSKIIIYHAHNEGFM